MKSDGRRSQIDQLIEKFNTKKYNPSFSVFKDEFVKLVNLYFYNDKTILAKEVIEAKFIELFNTTYFKELTFENKAYLLNSKTETNASIFNRLASSGMHYLLLKLSRFTNAANGQTLVSAEVLMLANKSSDILQEDITYKGKSKQDDDDEIESDIESQQSTQLPLSVAKQLLKEDLQQNSYLTTALILNDLKLSNDELELCLLANKDDSLLLKAYNNFNTDNLSSHQEHLLFIANHLDVAIELAINGTDDKRKNNNLSSIINLTKKYLDNNDPESKALYEAFIENVKGKLSEKYKDKVLNSQGALKSRGQLVKLLSSYKDTNPQDTLYITYLLLLLSNEKLTSDCCRDYISNALNAKNIPFSQFFISFSGYENEPLLHKTLFQNNLNLLQILLKNTHYKVNINYKSKNPNQPDREGFTPLEIAIRQVNLPMVELLVTNGADVNAFPSLYTAILKANPEIVQFLIENGAATNTITDEKTLLEHAEAIPNDHQYYSQRSAIIQALKNAKGKSETPAVDDSTSQVETSNRKSATNNVLSTTSTINPGDGINLTPPPPAQTPPAPNKPTDYWNLLSFVGVLAVSAVITYVLFPKIIDKVAPSFKTSPQYFQAQTAACALVGSAGAIILNGTKILNRIIDCFAQQSNNGREV